MDQWSKYKPARRLEDETDRERARAQNDASLFHAVDVETRVMVTAAVESLRDPGLRRPCAARLNEHRRAMMAQWRLSQMRLPLGKTDEADGSGEYCYNAAEGQNDNDKQSEARQQGALFQRLLLEAKIGFDKIIVEFKAHTVT